jgi:hypothetical protein
MNRVLLAMLPILFLSASTVLGEHQAMHMGHENKPTPTRGVTSLDVYTDGHSICVLSGLRLADGSDGLQYVGSNDAGEHWSAPVRVDQHMPTPYNRLGMDPQIAASGKHLIAVWTTRISSEYGRGPMTTSLSSDGGKTWRPGPNPADDGSSSDHGMIDIAADAAGKFHLVWLDARTGQKGLQYARSEDSGASWSRNQTLDPATCQCCWNTIALNPDGKIAVLYRSLSPRDMAVVVSPDGGSHWQKPVVVGSFGWKINACPHAGGGLAFSQCDSCNRCHAAVWTGESPSGVYALTSTNDGRQWLPPHRLGDASAVHPALATGPDGQVMVAFQARFQDHFAIFTAQSTDDGDTWSQPTQLSDSAVSAVYPHIIWTEKGFRVFWTQQSGDQPAVWKSALIGP